MRVSAPTQTVYYNTNNQITGGLVTYDAAGDVAMDTNAGNTYLYDGEGRICAVMSEPTGSNYTMTQYIYDAEGARVAKGLIATWSCDTTTNGFTPTKSYVLGPSNEQLSETDGQGNWLRTNVYAAGTLVATYDVAPTGSPALHFQLEDWLLTRRVQTDINGTPEETYTNLPFGDGFAGSPVSGAPATADDASELHFTGKERDSESGNDYFGARYYSSAMGRFMSPDWSAKVTPVPYANLGDPQSLNLYAYARNNPLIHIDANGHCWSWLQGACNFFQQAYHGIFTDDGFKTNAQVTDQTNKRRDALNQFNVVTPDKKGNTIDWSKATKKQVDGSYNALFSGGQINMNGPNFVSPGEAGSNPNTANATDAAGVAGLASDGKASKALGYVSAGTSLLNDPSPANGAITVLGLIPGPDVPIAIGTAAYDGSQFAAGVITSVVTAPSQANAVDESDPCSYGACQP